MLFIINYQLLFFVKEIRFWGKIGFITTRVKEIRFWGKIGLGATLVSKKSDFREKSDWERSCQRNPILGKNRIGSRSCQINPLFWKNRIGSRTRVKEILFFGKIGLGAALDAIKQTWFAWSTF
ncbi:MAG: hypothetical protein DRR19_09045 [Candidatus Parabeggiatoa sp. nov. 1]|nr:MAG: hypothetical protein DRR19_09045 [Gammaproteobacteria bacterium]